MECFPIRFVEDINLGGQVNPLEERAGIQGDLDRLEEWTGRNLMKFNKKKKAKSCTWEGITPWNNKGWRLLGEQLCRKGSRGFCRHQAIG